MTGSSRPTLSNDTQPTVISDEPMDGEAVSSSVDVTESLGTIDATDAGEGAGAEGPKTVVPEQIDSDAVLQLMRSAVTLQVEDLLRTIGALAMTGQDVREWTAVVERDVRDLAFLSSCAAAAGARLPAGLDGGAGDPKEPGSAIEGLLASHEALMKVLRQVAERSIDPRVRYTTRAVLDRREEQATVMRALGAGGGVPADVRLVHGTLPLSIR